MMRTLSPLGSSLAILAILRVDANTTAPVLNCYAAPTFQQQSLRMLLYVQFSRLLMHRLMMNKSRLGCTHQPHVMQHGYMHSLADCQLVVCVRPFWWLTQ